MRLCFILPGPSRTPNGGYRIVYEYADRLAGRGHDVTVLHSLSLPHTVYRKPLWVRYLGNLILGRYKAKWFAFQNKVKLRLITDISDDNVPACDAIIATWWATAYAVSQLKKAPERRYYLIQHYEDWAASKQLIDQTFRLGLRNIVISRWLGDILGELNCEVWGYIPNGIDLAKFKLSLPVEERNPNSIAMMYHEADWKGSRDGMAAIKTARQACGDLTTRIFSVYPKPPDMPSWVNYYHNPTQEELTGIYNRSSIFVSSSWAEGFGLPGAEAMACGSALVTTDSGGVKEYAVHQETALLSPPKAPDLLADNIISLLNDQKLRQNIARDGNSFIQSLNWNRAVDQMESVLLGKRNWTAADNS